MRPAGWLAPDRWLPLAALAAVVPFLGKPPSLDEESYLWLGARLDPLRPYDWSRVWPPYDHDGFVYAHPPLWLEWLALWRFAADWLPLERLLVGLPWVLLLGWSVGRLARRATRHPSLAAGLWLSSTVVVLGLHDTLMIDLGATALATAAVAAQLEHAVTGRPRWAWMAGLCLALGVATKYPVLAVVPALLLFQARRGVAWPVWIAAAGVVGAVEGWVYLAYGRAHLAEVWLRRGEIPAGPLDARLVGTLARAALLPLPLVLLRATPVTAAVGVGLGLLVLVGGRPEGVTGAQMAGLAAATATGGMAVARLGRGLWRRRGRRRHEDHDETLLLGAWGLAVVLGVVALHNYASARYLLPAAAPLALLVARSAEDVAGGKRLLAASIAVSAALALVVAAADLRFARAGVEVAEDVLARGHPPGRFAGEWSFRWRMEQGGWTRYRPDEALPPDTIVAVVDNASAGAVALDALEPVGRVESTDRFGPRVVDLDAKVGLHAETLGVLPLGLGRGPLEGATLYRAR